MSYVYAIGAFDAVPEWPIKIGIAVNVESRCRSLQAGCPIRLSILATWHITYGIARDIEVLCHRHFRHRNSHGEWFFVSVGEVSGFIEGLRERYVGPRGVKLKYEVGGRVDISPIVLPQNKGARLPERRAIMRDETCYTVDAADDANKVIVFDPDFQEGNIRSARILDKIRANPSAPINMALRAAKAKSAA